MYSAAKARAILLPRRRDIPPSSTEPSLALSEIRGCVPLLYSSKRLRPSPSVSSPGPVVNVPYCCVSYQSGIASASRSCATGTYSATAVVGPSMVRFTCESAIPLPLSCRIPLTFHCAKRCPRYSPLRFAVVTLAPALRYSWRETTPGGVEVSAYKCQSAPMTTAIFSPRRREMPPSWIPPSAALSGMRGWEPLRYSSANVTPSESVSSLGF